MSTKDNALESHDSIGYTGREWDFETGLYYYRARYYDPSIGRFISEDPIGFSGEDTNLYRYVENSPTNKIDPLGLWGWGYRFIIPPNFPKPPGEPTFLMRLMYLNHRLDQITARKEELMKQFSDRRKVSCGVEDLSHYKSLKEEIDSLNRQEGYLFNDFNSLLDSLLNNKSFPPDPRGML